MTVAPKADAKQAAPKKRGRRKGASCKFPGLVADAVALGCTASHLWKVRTGARISASLTARDAELQRQKKTQNNL